MRKRIKRSPLFFVGLIAGVLTGAVSTWAATAGTSSAQIPYTGHLEHNGGPVTGEVGMHFALYPSALSETVLWEETHDPSEAGRDRVDVANGEFSVMLGTYDDIESPTLRQATLFLGIDIVDETGALVPLGGRQQVGSMPFAWGGAPGQNFTIDGTLECPGCVGSGAIADGAVTDVHLAAGSVRSAEIADGNVTSADIQNGTVTSADIANGTVSGTDMTNNVTIGGTMRAGTLQSSGAAAESSTGSFYGSNPQQFFRCPAGQVAIGFRTVAGDAFLGHLRLLCKRLGTH